MAGHQPWWGNFLSNVLVNLYSSSSTHIFPQDRYDIRYMIYDIIFNSLIKLENIVH